MDKSGGAISRKRLLGSWIGHNDFRAMAAQPLDKQGEIYCAIGHSIPGAAAFEGRQQRGSSLFVPL